MSSKQRGPRPAAQEGAPSQTVKRGGHLMVRHHRAWRAISSRAESVFLSTVIVIVLSGMVSATKLNKSNTLTIAKDSATTLWTATCEVSVGGVDVNQIYSGRIYLQFRPSGAPSATTIFDHLFQVDPANRT